MINKVILMGRLTRDPELRHTTGNIPVTSFTLAIDRPYRKGNEKIADFIDVVAWRQTAEFICRYMQKGSMAIVSGYISTRTWTDKDGNNRKSTEVVADEVSFGESKRDSQQRSGGPFNPPSSQSSGEIDDIFEDSDDDFSETVSDDELPF
jgi:single-strand DNA-binding protein